MDQQRLKQRLNYDPLTGVFTWRAPEKRGQKPKGQIAGSPCNKGYLVIGIDKKVYKAHRLAWLYMTGSWPTAQIDHRNQVKNDNRWVNLRGATNQQNCCKRVKANKTGFRGVARQRNGKFTGKCDFAGKRRQKGGFDTPEAAAAWAENQRAKLHGEFARLQLSAPLI